MFAPFCPKMFRNSRKGRNKNSETSVTYLLHTGFAKEQGLSESVISIFMGAAGITGIVGTFFFPVLRSKVGLVRTGLFAFALDVITLTPCVASVFIPGSPFDPTFG